MIRTTIIIVVTTALLLLTATATTQQAAYGQTPGAESIMAWEPNEMTDMLVAEILQQLPQALQDNSDFGLLTIYDDGRIDILYDNGTPELSDDITIRAPHNYTLENGYEFQRDQIIKPDGTPLFTR